jgi:hypothetical protein
VKPLEEQAYEGYSAPLSEKFSKALEKEEGQGYAAFWIWTFENVTSRHMGN